MNYPGAAIGVMVFDPRGRVLLGKRKGELGPGEYSLPGGKVDIGETPFDAAAREVSEETNLQLSYLAFTGKVTNDYFPDSGKQYITLYYLADALDPAALKVMEPNKTEGWGWYETTALPQPMWMHTGMLITSLAEYDKDTAHAKWAFKTPDIDGKI
jgi:8-oxo-dGTP diphosphatase